MIFEYFRITLLQTLGNSYFYFCGLFPVLSSSFSHLFSVFRIWELWVSVVGGSVEVKLLVQVRCLRSLKLKREMSRR